MAESKNNKHQPNIPNTPNQQHGKKQNTQTTPTSIVRQKQQRKKMVEKSSSPTRSKTANSNGTSTTQHSTRQETAWHGSGLSPQRTNTGETILVRNGETHTIHETQESVLLSKICPGSEEAADPREEKKRKEQEKDEDDELEDDESEYDEFEDEDDNESKDEATPLVGQKDSKGRPKLNIHSMDKAIMEMRKKRDTERTAQRKEDVKGAEYAASQARKEQANIRTRNLRSIMPQRNEIQRYSLRVSIPTNNDPDTIVRNCLIAIFRKLQEIDKKLVIYPWDLRHTRSLPMTIENLTRMPKTIKKLQAYFPGIGRRYRQGYMSLSVLIGHNKSFRELTGPIFSWLKTENHGLWQKHLQVEESTRGGWLAYCYPGMDKNGLAEAIQAQTGFKVGLEWKQIYSGERVSKENAIYAFHVDIDVAEYDQCFAALQQIYGRDSPAADMPLGIRMRLIPEFSTALTKKGKDKILRFRMRQKGFVDNMMKGWSPDLDNIDVEETVWGGATLRQMIMQLRNPVRPSYSLFHSLQKTSSEFTNTGEPQVRFLFIPEAKELALSVINTPLTYLRFMYSDQDTAVLEKFDDYFNDAAKIKAAQLKWNRKTNEAVSEADIQLDGYDSDDDLDPMFDFTEAEGNLAGRTIIDPPKATSKLDPMKGSPDSDSISEFAPTTGTKRSRAKHPEDSVSVASSMSSDSDQELNMVTDNGKVPLPKDDGTKQDTYDLTGTDDHSMQSMTIASIQETINSTVEEAMAKTTENILEAVAQSNQQTLEQMNTNVQLHFENFMKTISSHSARNDDPMDDITVSAPARHGMPNP
jgi:hypothetical protein